MAFWSGILARPAKTPLSSRPSLMLFFLLVGAFLLTLVPHVIEFPFWISVLVVGAMVLRGIIEFYRLPLPSTTFCGLVAMVLAVAIFLQFGTLMGREAGTAFTAALLAIKFYELRRPRDVALIIFACFFLVMSILLYSQVLELFIYSLIMMWLLTSLLLRVHTGDLPHDQLLRMLGKAGIIFLQALPLALFLFFFFPRYHGTLSLVLSDPTIGLTDTVAPGSIAKLSQDDSEAMYVQFTQGNPPLPESMYWRVVVLSDYDHGVWKMGQLAQNNFAAKQLLEPTDRGAAVLQEITVQKSNQRWLFALDVPVSVPVNSSESSSWAGLFKENIVQLRDPMAKLDHKARYTVYSSQTPVEEDLNASERGADTYLPAGQINQKVKDLAKELHQGLNDDQVQEYYFAVLRYFRHGHFLYTTEPGAQGPDWLPNFLFKTRRGFCEHFASAFAVLMRLENVPTRLVAGYLGGEYNPYNSNYTVYQSNAHAWDEIWIQDKNQPAEGLRGHWIRIDPTALITSVEEPGEMGSNKNNAEGTGLVKMDLPNPGFAETYLPSWAKEDLKEMKLRREQVETQWDNAVLSYNPETQTRLTQAFGFGETAGVGILLVACLVAGGICLVVFRKWTKQKTPVTPVENLYALFCRNMAQRGIPRATWEGPLAYTERVAEAFPDDKETIQRVGSIVATVRYGAAPVDPAVPENLKSLLTLLTASQAAATSRDKR